MLTFFVPPTKNDLLPVLSGNSLRVTLQINWPNTTALPLLYLLSLPVLNPWLRVCPLMPLHLKPDFCPGSLSTVALSQSAVYPLRAQPTHLVTWWRPICCCRLLPAWATPQPPRLMTTWTSTLSRLSARAVRARHCSTLFTMAGTAAASLSQYAVPACWHDCLCYALAQHWRGLAHPCIICLRSKAAGQKLTSVAAPVHSTKRHTSLQDWCNLELAALRVPGLKPSASGMT